MRPTKRTEQGAPADQEAGDLACVWRSRQVARAAQGRSASGFVTSVAVPSYVSRLLYRSVFDPS